MATDFSILLDASIDQLERMINIAMNDQKVSEGEYVHVESRLRAIAENLRRHQGDEEPGTTPPTGVWQVIFQVLRQDGKGWLDYCREKHQTEMYLTSGALNVVQNWARDACTNLEAREPDAAFRYRVEFWN
jgi:hypothetical protein